MEMGFFYLKRGINEVLHRIAIYAKLKNIIKKSIIASPDFVPAVLF
jgi:hypothetical protein